MLAPPHPSPLPCVSLPCEKLPVSAGTHVDAGNGGSQYPRTGQEQNVITLQPLQAPVIAVQLPSRQCCCQRNTRLCALAYECASVLTGGCCASRKDSCAEAV